MTADPASSVQRAVERARARPRRPVDRTPRILVAEDDDEMRQLIVEALSRDGYDVREAVDGGRLLVEITAQLQNPETEVDLIITDIRMPVCTGFDIIKGLRDAHCDTPVIVMTAFGDDRTRTQAAELDAILFDKPFTLDDLRTAIVNLVPRDHTFDTTAEGIGESTDDASPDAKRS